MIKAAAIAATATIAIKARVLASSTTSLPELFIEIQALGGK
jgi:hypothetical protein